jgi:predicted dienelactone hydrolase
MKSPARSARRVFKSLALTATLAAGAFAGSLWVERNTAVELPPPTGPFPVGRALYDWVDDETLDALAPVPGTKRELLVWIWYPTAPKPSSAATAEYLPAPMRAPVERVRPALINFLTRDLSKVQTHSFRNADISPRQPSYPVVMMRAGASAEVWNYSTLAEDLASHGYVVVGLDAPYRTHVVAFPDGRVMIRAPENNPELGSGEQQVARVNRVLAAWTADMGFVLDRLQSVNLSDPSGRFTGRLDMTRVGAFGHSFGGAQAAQFCHADSRCKAGIDVDGALFGSVIQQGIHKPFMFLLSDHSRESDPESAQIRANIQSVYDRLPADRRLCITIRGANHYLFSDDAALMKSSIVMRTLRILGVLGMGGRRQLAITAHCVHSFFDAYLKGANASPLNISSPLYPEIQILQD